MKRRDWFKLSAMAGGAMALNTLPSLANGSYFRHPLDDANEDLARLCYNENPYGPSESARAAIMESMKIAYQYPFAYIQEFQKTLALKHNVSPEHIVICGGSVEGLRAAGLAFCKPGGKLISPDPTYLSMMQYVSKMGTKVVNVPAKTDLSHDLEQMAAAVDELTNLVFVCNPNNPTGTFIGAKRLISFLDEVSIKVPVFVDEAYFDYVDDPSYASMIDLVKKNYNIIVSRTFSKVYGLAGMRIGYLIAKPEIASLIRDRIQASANIPAIKAAEAALADTTFYAHSQQINRDGRKMIAEACDQLGLEYVKPQTNFVFIKTNVDVNAFNERMRAKNVLVGRGFPPLTQWCRVSTGKISDIERFIKVLPDALKV